MPTGGVIRVWSCTGSAPPMLSHCTAIDARRYAGLALEPPAQSLVSVVGPTHSVLILTV